MPTYVYECKECNETFEVQQRITEDPLTTCRCGTSGKIKRVIQPIAVMFKGEGFHINDYAPKTGGSTVTTPSESKPSAPASTETSTAEAPAETPAPVAPAASE
jgi:putative FmdB family regulatory protein